VAFFIRATGGQAGHHHNPLDTQQTGQFQRVIGQLRVIDSFRRMQLIAGTIECRYLQIAFFELPQQFIPCIGAGKQFSRIETGLVTRPDIAEQFDDIEMWSAGPATEAKFHMGQAQPGDMIQCFGKGKFSKTICNKTEFHTTFLG